MTYDPSLSGKQDRITRLATSKDEAIRVLWGWIKAGDIKLADFKPLLDSYCYYWQKTPDYDSPV